MNQRALKKILTYKNTDVVDRFAQTYGVPSRVARGIFQDLLRFLWLSKRFAYLEARRPKRFKHMTHLELLSQLDVVDAMWHLFMIHSEDYGSFCEKYFGEMLHHRPAPATAPAPKQQPRRKPAATNANDESRDLWFEEYIGFIVEELGSATALRWHKAYPEKYHAKQLLLMQLKALRE